MKRSIFALALLAAAPAAAGDLYVVDSTAAALPVGAFAADTQLVALAAGETVTLIAEDGSTRVISGPYKGPIAGGAADTPGALARIARAREDSAQVVGAIRAPAWDQ
ncbi:hypothetical protein ACQ5SO_05605 [Rhodovulum sp. DZ06]|uniref:hypothetical protein n=1 Tax=Rhodovulum sp. DZ06 TaxID=3425126 RepID=UPI003D34EB1A